MAAPATTIWDLDPHTKAKHEILKRYLQAWAPILSQGRFPELLYIDGFSGPGRYSNGEDGSPIIALRAALQERVITSTKLRFLFVEKQLDRAKFLETLVAELKLPKHFQVDFGKGTTFESEFVHLIESFRSLRLPFPPTFAFIDPFGWTGAPFWTVREIMSHPSCEVLVTFMYEEINRFIGHPDQSKNFDAFFGTHKWAEGIDIRNPDDRNRFLHDLYVEQLKASAGAKFVRSFQMRNKSNAVDYYLFFATNNLLGLKKMKEAMWKVDDRGDFAFSDATDKDQFVLFSGTPTFEILRKQILEKFAGKIATIQGIEEFVLVETAFRETHYKRQILRPLEFETPPGLKIVNPQPGRKRGTYGQATLQIKFS